MKDANGNRMDPRLAVILGHAGGTINGGIELAQWTTALKAFGITGKAWTQAGRAVVRKLAKDGTLQSIALNTVGNFGVALTAETAQEVGQETTNVVFEAMAVELNKLKGKEFPHITAEALKERYAQVTEQSLRAFGIMLAPGVGISGAVQGMQVRAAIKDEKARQQPIRILRRKLGGITVERQATEAEVEQVGIETEIEPGVFEKLTSKPIEVPETPATPSKVSPPVTGAELDVTPVAAPEGETTVPAEAPAAEEVIVAEPVPEIDKAVGEKITVFHGTGTKGIKVLKSLAARGKATQAGIADSSLIWFSDNKNFAEIFASDFTPSGESLGVTGEVLERTIDLSKVNLWEVSFDELTDYIKNNASDSSVEFAKRLRANGFDGIKLTDKNIDAALGKSVGVTEHAVFGLLKDPPITQAQPAPAAEEGKIEVFHSGKQGIPTKLVGHKGLHFGTEKAASERSDTVGEARTTTKAILNIKNPYLPDGKMLDERTAEGRTDLFSIQNLESKRKDLAEQGFDAIPYINAVEDVGSISYIVLDPSIVEAQPAPAAAKPKKKPPQPAKDSRTTKPAPIEKEITNGKDLPPVTTIRKADVAADREALGLAGLPSEAKLTDKKAHAQAIAEGIPDRALRMAALLESNPRALSKVEEAGFRIAYRRLVNEHNNILDQVRQTNDEAAIKSLTSEMEIVENDTELLGRAISATSREAGRSLQGLKAGINSNFDLVSVVTRAKANKGENISAAERAGFEKLTADLDEANQKIDSLQTQMNELAAQKATQQSSRAKRFGRMSSQQLDTELNTKVELARELLKKGCY